MLKKQEHAFTHSYATKHNNLQVQNRKILLLHFSILKATGTWNSMTEVQTNGYLGIISFLEF